MGHRLCTMVGSTALAIVALSGCVPHDMHVVRGLDPRFSDDDVRFRTTYYFRTFDFCWDMDAPLKLSASATTSTSYQRIIPKTDTLYRYRMTGKASAAFSRIRFESGVLKAADIDPFGTQVTYSEAGDGFVLRNAAEVKEQAEAAGRLDKTRLLRLQQLRELTDYYAGLDRTSTELRAAGLEAIKKALVEYQAVGATLATTDTSDLDKEMKAISAKVTALGVKDAGLEDALAKLRTTVATTAAFDALGVCSVGEKVRKGFQIMGPEGLKTYDQNDRLVMAMSSSAKPLIDTLQEYSGRVLQSRVDVTSQLLAIASENLRTEVARREISDARATSPDADAILTKAIEAFERGSGVALDGGKK